MDQALKRYTAVAILVAGMTGCTGFGHNVKVETPTLDSKDEVAALASARWDALIQGDLAKAYEYLSPGVRSVMSLDAYKARIRTGSWKKATVDSVSCDKDLCKVTMLIEQSFRDIKSLKTPVFEDWLQESGKWWYVPKN
ncbi:MAG: hypothetical protein WA435_12000 [Gallionellaceae bacterium]